MKRELLGSRLHIDYVEVTNCVTSSWYYICIIMKGCFFFFTVAFIPNYLQTSWPFITHGCNYFKKLE